METPNRALRILIVQIADIGDMVLSTPALAALRDRYPTAHITLLTTPNAAPVVQGSPLIDEIILFERRTGWREPGKLFDLARRLRRGRHEITLFLHHFSTWAGTLKFAAIALAAGSKRRIGLDGRGSFFLSDRLENTGFGGRHQAQYWLDLAALIDADDHPISASAVIGENDRLWAAQMLPDRRPRVVIHSGSGGDSYARRWSVEDFAAVAAQMAEKHRAQIVLVGSPADNTSAVLNALPPHVQALDLTGKTTLPQLGAVLEQADVFIGADSGVMHMACAAGAPVVAIFGPSNADAWGAWTPHGKSIVLRSAPECSPCSYVGFELGERAGCAARTCMRMITPEKVVQAAERILAGEISGAAPPTPIKARPPQPTVTILGMPVSAITYERWLEQIESWMHDPPEQTRHVCTINPEMVMIARRDAIFRQVLRRADITVPDGVGLLWAARRLGQPLPERVTGSDGVPLIAERAARAGWKIFLLGAAEGVAAKAADILKARYPGLKIAGTYSGSPAPEDEDALFERINASGADILFVAYGAPEQDKWIARNLPRLTCRMAMGVGGSFDFIAGVVPRAPLWMRRSGLEWLYRLYLQPRRIGRMLRLPRFALLVLLRGERA